MGVPIEHRDKESVMRAFDFFDRPNFAIYLNKDQRTAHSFPNKEEAAEKLSEYLDMIEGSNTGGVYTLKVYPEGANINSKTPHDASTTFMLANIPVTKTESGVTIIDRPAQAANYAAGNQRIQALELENASLRDKLHKAELALIEAKFEHRIAGLTNTPDKPTLVENLVDKVTEKPEMIGEVFKGLGSFVESLANAFSSKQAINGPAAQPPQQPEQPEATIYSQVAGTEHQDININHIIDERMQEQDNIGDMQLEEDNDEGTPEEQALWDRQDKALELLAEKIGEETLTNALEKLAQKDSSKLGSILKFL